MGSMNRLEACQMTDELHLLHHCAPVFFLPEQGALPGTIKNNGTLALIDGGQRTFLVTCCHVWDGFIDYRNRVSTARLASVFADGFGAPILLAEERLIDCDRELDLAVFEASPADWNCGHKEFYRPDRWPIPCAKQGSPIAFVGFAGAGRHAQGAIGDFRYSAFGLTVTSSSDRKMVLAMDQSHGQLRDNDGQPTSAMPMGGLSGSPAYVRSMTGRFSLAGFVQMGQTSDDDIFLTHASFLNQDGTLRS